MTAGEEIKIRFNKVNGTKNISGFPLKNPIIPHFVRFYHVY